MMVGRAFGMGSTAAYLLAIATRREGFSALNRSVACALLASTALATPALAQDAMSETISLPRQELDQNGVNPANGQLVLYQTLLSIGPSGRAGLRYILAHGNAIN